jgi:hypothetical protein
MIVLVQTNALEVKRKLDLKSQGLRRAEVDAAKDLANRMWLDMIRVTQNWQHRVKFDKVVEIKGDVVTVLVGTDDKIYKFLDRGTRVRYATMSLDFQPKTHIGVLGSGKGAGGLLFVSKKHPRPGIKARRYTETITEKYNVMADRLAEKHIREWAKS